MAVKDAKDSHFGLADYVEDAIGKPVHQRPPNLAMNFRVCLRVLPDVVQTLPQLVLELERQLFPLIPIPSVNFTDFRFGGGSEP